MIETEKVIATGTGICRNRSKDWKSVMNRKRNRKRSKKVTETTRGQEQEQCGKSYSTGTRSKNRLKKKELEKE
jgi:hypothetical protein